MFGPHLREIPKAYMAISFSFSLWLATGRSSATYLQKVTETYICYRLHLFAVPSYLCRYSGEMSFMGTVVVKDAGGDQKIRN